MGDLLRHWPSRVWEKTGNYTADGKAKYVSRPLNRDDKERRFLVEEELRYGSQRTSSNGAERSGELNGTSRSSSTGIGGDRLVESDS